MGPRLLLVALLLLVPACGDSSRPAPPSPTAALPDPLVPTAPATATTDPLATPDGTTYAYLRRLVRTATGADAVVYDKVDHLASACAALASASPRPTSRQADRVCFRNVNPVERTVPLAPDAVLVATPADGPPRLLDVAGLRALLGQVRSDPPLPITAFRLQVEGGLVVRLEEVRPV